jgi:uncharacterized lipoprotein YmbA
MNKALFLPLLVLMSCVRVDVGSDPATLIIHKLDYGSPIPGNETFNTALRLRDFSASDEYDRKALVLILADGTVRRTGLHQWASTPAVALADLLHRDLLVEGSFQVVHRSGSRRGEEVLVEGFVREFGARQSSAEWVAVLDMDLLLTDTGAAKGSEQKTYRLLRTMTDEGYDSLVRTLSYLANEWSEKARSDIRAFVGSGADH